MKNISDTRKETMTYLTGLQSRLKALKHRRGSANARAVAALRDKVAGRVEECTPEKIR